MDKISLQCLVRLPPNGILSGPSIVQTIDMDGKERSAIKWVYSDKWSGARLSYFCVDTGDYLGDII